MRADHITEAASQVQKMQQALERMNIKFHDVISELTGVSGMKVIKAILAGEHQPERLLELCDKQIQKKKSEQVLASLHGVWAPEPLFALGQALSVWEFYQKLLAECDRQVEAVLKDLAGPPPASPPNSPEGVPAEGKAPKAPGKNAPQIDDLHALLVRICGGRDATSLPGVADYLWRQVVAETGTDMGAGPTEKHFTAWCGLAPGTRQSGKRKGSVRRQRNRAGRLFCVGARSLVQSVDKGLGGFVRRISRRKGGLVATKALARKLAQLYYRVLRYGLEYAERGLREYELKYEESQPRLLGKLATKLGFQLVSERTLALHAAISPATCPDPGPSHP